MNETQCLLEGLQSRRGLTVNMRIWCHGTWKRKVNSSWAGLGNRYGELGLEQNLHRVITFTSGRMNIGGKKGQSTED